MPTKKDPDINENYLHDEYTDDELNEDPNDTHIPGVSGPFGRGVYTGGTLGGDAVGDGSTIDDGAPRAPRTVTGWDSSGDEVPQDPALEGTVAGNTNAAQALVGGPRPDRTPQTPEEDLGPEGTIVQKIGGEARY